MLIHSIRLVWCEHRSNNSTTLLQSVYHFNFQHILSNIFLALLQNHHCGYTNSPKRYKLKPYAAISKVLHLLCLFWSISPCRFYLCLFRHQHAFNRKQQRSHENFVHKKTTCRQKTAAYQRLKLIKNSAFYR